MLFFIRDRNSRWCVSESLQKEYFLERKDDNFETTLSRKEKRAWSGVKSVCHALGIFFIPNWNSLCTV